MLEMSARLPAVAPITKSHLNGPSKHSIGKNSKLGWQSFDESHNIHAEDRIL